MFYVSCIMSYHVSEWNEPSGKTDLARWPTQGPHKSTKTSEFILDGAACVKCRPSSISHLAVTPEPKPEGCV